MVRASKRAGLGNTLIRAQRHVNDKRNPRKNPDKHTLELPEQQTGINLRSVTAQTNLDEFFEEAELAGKQFVTERRNLVLIDGDDNHLDLYSENEKAQPKHEEIIDIPGCLSVPRRPHWDSSTTPEVLAEREKLSFLSWRRKLARIQEMDNVLLTPFEKNLEVWRQLWRVLERSDIVVQILDSRNPLLYLCEDLIKYVNEEFKGEKINLILLNKADYLTKEQRRIWYKFFQTQNIKSIFFSALLENENLKKPNPQTTKENSNHSAGSDQSESSSDENEEETSDKDSDVSEELKKKLNFTESDLDEETRVVDKFELLDIWRKLLEDLRGKEEKTPSEEKEEEDEDEEQAITPIRPPTVGLVGYPNVGKSSTINALLSAKRVAVSATPGKTKHFQTFLIDQNMMLCDCPGLVFPNFVNSKSEMIINGILPIDQMKDCVNPVRIIVDRIPRGFFEEIYGLAFEQEATQNITAEDLLNALGFMRGYMTARGLPDISRAARRVCKDYINGKILYCEPPPDCDKKLYSSYSKLAAAMERIKERSKNPELALKITERQRRLMAQAKGTDISSQEFDRRYLQTQCQGVHIKGLPGIGNMTQPIGQVIGTKPPKREKKHKKKEKLRRVYRDLDI